MQATEISPYWPHLQVQTFTRTQSTLVNIKEVKFCITTWTIAIFYIYKALTITVTYGEVSV